MSHDYYCEIKTKDQQLRGAHQKLDAAPTLSKCAHAVIFVLKANDPRLICDEYNDFLQEIRKQFQQDGNNNMKISFLLYSSSKIIPSFLHSYDGLHPRRPRATSRDDGIFSCERYFRRESLLAFTSRADECQKLSKSVHLIGQKNMFSGQSARRSSRVTLSPSYTK